MTTVHAPATIAVLGAGPIGLEAALYGRFLGYEVRVYERGQVGEHLLQFSHVRLFSPFGMNCSPLGLAALKAQDQAWRPPPEDAVLTARQFVESYLRPLAQSDLLADRVMENTQVVAIGRQGQLKADHVGMPERSATPFVLLIRDAQGAERLASADIVIDASGTFGQHNWLGIGGVPAPGEIAAEARIDYGLPDILGACREQFAGRNVLVVGAGYTAATNVVALAQLAREAPSTRVTWVMRRALANGTGPLAPVLNDRLSERARLCAAANAVARGGAGAEVRLLDGTWVESLAARGESLLVRLVGQHAQSLVVDRVLASVGYRPDRDVYRELQVHECYASEGPMKLAAALLSAASADCLDQKSSGPSTLVNPEPNLYILGAKSYGRRSTFLIALGLEQIREAFSIIGGRAELNVYATIRH